MNDALYPCIWYDNNAKEAVTFYKNVFENVKITSENPMVVLFEINGTKFMGLNGGPQFKPNPAISYFIYCEGKAEMQEQIYEKLKEGGQVLIPMGKYEWSAKYAFVQDQFGVSWQLDIDKTNTLQKVVPALLFVNDQNKKVKEAVDFYTTVFKDSKQITNFPFPAESGFPEGTLLFAQFSLNGFILNAMSGNKSKHAFDFSEGNSFVIECETQAEIDYYWYTFSQSGTESMCGWVKDQYGVWWQVVPSILKALMSSPEQQQVIDAFMKMKKFDIATLKRAAGQ